MSKRTRTILIALFLFLLLLLALLFSKCTTEKTKVVSTPPAPTPASAAGAVASTPPAPAAAPVADVLSPATLTVPATVPAGAAFSVQWIGPNNSEDYVTIVKTDAAEGSYEDYKLTRQGTPIELTARTEPGPREVRYVAGRAKKVLGRAPIDVRPTSATLAAADKADLGTVVSVTWTGPNNVGDYLTVVSRETPDGQYGNYTLTREGSPLKLTLPVDAGEAEIRYMTGKDRKVLGRRAITVTVPDTSLSASDEVPAGSTIEVTWRGPNNSGDYVTIVPKGTADGQYKNYTVTRAGSPLKLLALIDPGEAELRYMTGTNARVLARRPITLQPVSATFSAPAEAAAGSVVEVTWTGPAYGGDYVTIVPASAPDTSYAAYQTARGTGPLKIAAPKQPGPAQIRYVTGQGARVLGRRPITITP